MLYYIVICCLVVLCVCACVCVFVCLCVCVCASVSGCRYSRNLHIALCLQVIRILRVAAYHMILCIFSRGVPRGKKKESASHPPSCKFSRVAFKFVQTENMKICELLKNVAGKLTCALMLFLAGKGHCAAINDISKFLN